MSMKLFALPLLLVFLLSTGLAQTTKIPKHFKRKLKTYHVQFFIPKDFVIVPSLKHDDLPNEFTIAKSLEEFEIRYAIQPLKKDLKTYKKNLKNPTVRLIHPNFLWKSTLQARIKKLAISEFDTPNLREFSEEAFNEEFKGDAGGICFFTLSPESGIGYKYAIAMVIHRNFVADLHVTFLGNNEEKLQELSLEAFHAMGFKN